MAEQVVREPAPAKINPFLRVLRRRDDGYHEVETLIQPITLSDGLEARTGGELTLEVAGPEAAGVPPGEDNLALRAARALAGAAGRKPEAALLLAKKIPAAAGLGGGSADAAATLRALDLLWGLGWDRERLSEVAAGLGSDVPALLHGGPVLARGRGEKVEPARVARTWWVLVTVPFGVSSADAYAWWDEDGETGPDPGRLLDALSRGVAESVAPLLFNDLEGPVARRHPEVAETRTRLLEAGAAGAVMCGSGPTVAGLCRDGKQVEDVAAACGGIPAGTITRAV